MTDTVETDLPSARRNLACALRWAARLGLHEGVCNHFSLVEPGRDDRFLINAYGMHWTETTASSLLLLDSDGELVEGDAPPEPTAFYIHWRIHRAAPHARCVMHTHMPYATALAMVEGGRLEPAGQSALMFHDRIAYDDDYQGLALDEAEGDRMAAKLGNRSVMFLANHGVLVTGATVAEAFNRLYYLERACMHQVLAMSTGRPLKLVPEDIARRTAQQMAEDCAQAERHFAALRRILDAEEPSYAA